jgi:deoxycytidylate deaminase
MVSSKELLFFSLRQVGMVEEGLWRAARRTRRRSTCLKTQTAAVIVKHGRIIARHANICAPEGVVFGEMVPRCPRISVTTGAHYELCRSVHAEVAAALSVRKNRSAEDYAHFAAYLAPTVEEIRGAFTEEELDLLSGATLYLAGHYFACEHCVRFLEAVGITDIRFDPRSSTETKLRYERSHLDS